MTQKPSTTEWRSQANLRVLLNSAKLALDYERSRAPHPVLALSAFSVVQRAVLARILRLGFRHHIELTQLELACAQAGFGYARGEGVVGPPWWLPDALLTLPTMDLPDHPLVEAQWLSELIKGHPHAQGCALDALYEILSPTGLSSRWAELPRVGYASLPIPGKARIAVCLHMFYPEMWPTLRSALEVIPEPWDLYVSVPEFACTRTLTKIADEHPAIRFLPCVNRGRDVLPFLRWLELGIFNRYDVVCKLHSKRSPHMSSGAQWLSQALQSLLKNSHNVATILEKFRGAPDVGLIGPRALRIDTGHPTYRGGNLRTLEVMARRAALPKAKLSCPFFAGTMFWFRPSALTGLLDLKLNEEMFPIEMAQTDGTPAHALERLIWPLVEKAGFKVEEA